MTFEERQHIRVERSKVLVKRLEADRQVERARIRFENSKAQAKLYQRAQDVLEKEGFYRDINRKMLELHHHRQKQQSPGQ